MLRCAGSSLPAVSAEQIFQALNTTKPAGLGMGLSICR
jgi:signal transduction histidine kinase